MVIRDGDDTTGRPHLDHAVDPLCTIRPDDAVLAQGKPGVAIYRATTQCAPWILCSHALLISGEIIIAASAAIHARQKVIRLLFARDLTADPGHDLVGFVLADLVELVVHVSAFV